LIEEGILTPGTVQADGIVPLRLDFIMSDVRSSIIGRSNVVTTTAAQVGDIVRDLRESGIVSINSGLFGFQNGGITTGKPWALDFTRSIGTRRDFERLFAEMGSLGADMSFAQDYLTINSYQMNLTRNQSYHMNRWGLGVQNVAIEYFIPVQFTSYARANRAAEWFTRQTGAAIALGAQSVTAGGITEQIVTHHSWQENISAQDVVAIFQNAFSEISVPINARNPNMYLWPYVDRYLQTPVFNAQYILATDTVPFLQMVLNNTMELYAPHSNFNFYTRQDVLRMIDYNVFPSFIITHEPAHLLSSTNSLFYFSTEYSIYRDIILDVYQSAAPILSQIKGLEWINRLVLSEGVILNVYGCGLEVLINYTEFDFYYRGVSVAAVSAEVFNGE
jgi:hypothetical protein